MAKSPAARPLSWHVDVDGTTFLIDPFFDNPFTDLDVAEPPVTESQIVAVAWQPSGQVVTIPNFGTAILAGRVVVTNVLTAATTVLGVEQAAESWQAGSVMLVSGVILFAISIGSGIVNGSSRERARSRGQDTFDPRYAALFLTAIIIVPANIAMVAPSSTQHIAQGVARTYRLRAVCRREHDDARRRSRTCGDVR